eukprot:TRINITY_DN1612_c0_g1_i1.p1 TRINITY_DN1612_c0_g1~~TRINITY_DN1612_c0_g1_i1.p1  ORF type:complete len:60 (+),score=3.49 TRINITY_DN1612_c0_g1_i1:82-261(+)
MKSSLDPGRTICLKELAEDFLSTSAVGYCSYVFLPALSSISLCVRSLQGPPLNLSPGEQ